MAFSSHLQLFSQFYSHYHFPVNARRCYNVYPTFSKQYLDSLLQTLYRRRVFSRLQIVCFLIQINLLHKSKRSVFMTYSTQKNTILKILCNCASSGPKQISPWKLLTTDSNNRPIKKYPPRALLRSYQVKVFFE